MLTYNKSFSGFSTNDISAAKEFYNQTLGINATEENGMLTLHLENDKTVLIYPKNDHVPATYTVLNFIVNDLDAAMEEMKGKGIVFEQYENLTDENGVARGIARHQGPDIAWFKDPAGNILSVLKEA